MATPRFRLHLHSRRARAGLVLIALGAYALAFAPLHFLAGDVAGALSFLPAALGGWLLGPRAGFLLGLLILPLNVLLYRWVRDPMADRFAPFVAATVALSAIGAFVGWLSKVDEHGRAQAHELVRANVILAALSRVAARVQTGLDPESLLKSLEVELRKIGLTFVVALFEPGDEVLTIRHTSFHPTAMALAEKLTGLTIRDIRVPRERWPHSQLVFDQRRAEFVTEVLEPALAILPGLPRPVVAQLLQIVGIHASAAIVAPLAVEQRTIGALLLWGPALEESDLPAATVFAAQVAAAFEVARLHERVKAQHVEEQATLLRLSQALLVESEAMAMAQIAARAAAEALRVELAVVVLMDVKNLRCTGLAGVGWPPEVLRQVQQMPLPAASGLANTLRQGRAVVVPDPSGAMPFPLPPWAAAAGVVASILVPMKAGETPIGGLIVDSRTAREWSEAEVRLLSLIAGDTALAVERARLFEAEREQRALAESLREVTAALNSTLELDEVLDLILGGLEQVVKHDAADIMLVEEGVARVVRHRGRQERDWLEWLRGVRFPVRELHTLSRMAQAGQPLIVTRTSADPLWTDFEPTRWMQSYVGAPICLQGEAIGFVNLGSQTPDFFTPAHAGHLEAFAHQCAIAIANARLHAEVRRRAEQLARLNDITRAALSTTHFQDMLQTLADRLGELVGCDGYYITLWDEVEQQAIPMVAYGEFRDTYATSVQLDPSETTMTASVIRAGRPLVAEDALNSPYLSPRIAAMFPQRSLLGLPLIAGAARLGAVLVAFNRPHHFTPDEIALGEQAAGQIALAVAKAQLIERLAESARRANRLAAAAEEANRLKTEFLANTSHELRTPLAAIVGSLALVLDGMCDSREEEHKFVRIAHESSEQLMAAVSDLLDIAKIEAGKMELAVVEFDLAPVLAEVHALWQAPAGAKKLCLRVEPPPASAPAVRGDPGKVRQILNNLVGNAVKFTEDGEVFVGVQADEESVRVVVRDTGIGIPLDVQPRLFKPFVQADGSMTRQYPGTGLGLSISRRLAEMMGGALTLHSAGPGQGSTFTLTLLAAPAAVNALR